MIAFKFKIPKCSGFPLSSTPLELLKTIIFLLGTNVYIVALALALTLDLALYLNSYLALGLT